MPERATVKPPKVSRMSIEELKAEHAMMDWRAKASGRGMRLQGRILHLAVMKGCDVAKTYAETQSWNTRGST